MTAQGLLVKGTNGEDYLLTTEPNHGTRTHRLMVVKKVNEQWKPVEGVQELGCREALIGAFVDFVVDLCRVLNSSEPQPASGVVSLQRPSPAGGQTGEPAQVSDGSTDDPSQSQTRCQKEGSVYALSAVQRVDGGGVLPRRRI